MRYTDFDDRRQERPVRLDKTEGTVIIEGKAYPAREIVEALAQSGYSEIRSNGDTLILGRKRITPIFKSPKERAMASLCHGSLAYCCPLSKRCAERDRALEILGLSLEEYERLKGESHIRFMDVYGHESSYSKPYDWSPPSRERVINRPAADRGYGSDDYRRDFDRLDSVLGSRREGSLTKSWRDGSGPDRERKRQMARGRSPFTDIGIQDDLMKEMHQAVRERTPPPSCSITSDASVEGIGSLFSQGELSPFADDGQKEERLSFCFSCGRTFNPNTKVCPYCGVPQ